MRILLVDDEQSVLQLLCQFMVRSGHEVVTAASVAEFEKLRQEGLGELDAAVIDLSLPDGSGEDIAKSVLAHDPEIRTIIATGYAYDPPSTVQGKIEVMQKPFLPRKLLALLDQ